MVWQRNVRMPTSAEALHVAGTFPTLVKAHNSKLEDDVVTQRQLETLLSDAVDIVEDNDDVDSYVPKSSGRTSRVTPTAFMMTIDPTGPVSDKLGGPTGSGRQRLYRQELETVDPLTDPESSHCSTGAAT